MCSFLALYRGPTIGAARLIAVSADPTLVAEFATRLLAQPDADAEGDPVVEHLHRGRRRALQLVQREADQDG
ncbi:MAG: hypothetical protein M3008_06095 [Chloroflexota bacterium]|nr:hypothetical protein [Chloroflexota bacterium]